jgi:hypothetical protein
LSAGTLICGALTVIAMTIYPMGKKETKTTFKLGTAALTFVLTSLLTWISFFFYFMKDEGQIDNDAWFLNLIADSYLAFRLPLHAVLWDIIKDNTTLFYLTLFLNPIFWSILMERLINWTRQMIRT